MSTNIASESNATSEGLRAQDELVRKLDAAGPWTIVVGDAFVRGMRDIGYKDTAYAAAELIDNALQAAASRVDVVFGYDRGAKPTQVAVVDDGYGMQPQMVRASLMWGAGTRFADRTGYGKYGYGLPSASVSQCQRVTVYSKTESGTWHSCHLDVEEISRGDWGHSLEMPKVKVEEPPQFVVEFLTKGKRWPDFGHGTVIVWDKLDRIENKLRDPLRAMLLSNLGVIYRNVLVQVPMTVDGVPVEPCDPLFMTEGFRGYDIDEDRAVGLPGATIDVKDGDHVIGNLRIRYARMPATFFRVPEAKHTNRPGRNQTNERLEIRDANLGIIFTRAGRQIEVIRQVRSIPGGAINATTDRFWAVEVDFDPTLDDFFSITTSKQQVRPDPKIWDILKDRAKLFTAIGEMRSAYDKEAKVIAAKNEADKSEKRASIAAIEAAEKFRPKPPEESPERAKEAEENLHQEARKRADRAGVKPEVVEREITANQVGKARAVETEDMPGAPFFRCVQLGGQRILYLNVGHPFYRELYGSADATPRLRASLEVLLWVLGDAEVDSNPGSDRRQFYEQERGGVWSPQVAAALMQLKRLPLMEADEPTAVDMAQVAPDK